MPISKNFLLKKVGKEHMIIPLSEGGVDFSKVYNVSETGAFIFEELSKGKNLEEIASKITKEYEISYEIALADIHEFVEDLKKRGMYND